MRETMKEKLAQVDIRIVLVILLIIVSTGHVGRIFADREAKDQWQIGYLLAVAIDGVLAVALYEASYADEKRHKVLAIGGFVATCAISSAFNVYYYRLFHPTDPFWTSVLLGTTAPTLAAFVALLKSKGDVARQKTHNLLELEKFTIEQEEETKRAIGIAEQKTEQSKELTKRRKIIAEEKVVKRAVEEAEKERLQKVLIDKANRCWCGQEITSPRGWGPHGKKHTNDARKILAGGKVTLQTLATELETLYGQQPPDEELRRLYNKYRTDF